MNAGQHWSEEVIWWVRNESRLSKHSKEINFGVQVLSTKSLLLICSHSSTLRAYTSIASIMQFTSRSVSDAYLMMCGFFFPFSGEGWGVGGVGLFLMFLFLLIQSTHSLLRVGDRNPYGSSNQRSHSNFSWGEALNINFPPSSVCVPLCVSIALIFFSCSACEPPSDTLKTTI